MIFCMGITESEGRSGHKDVVLPCLLDRLTDRYPLAKKDSEKFRYITLDQYRDSVLRDLFWLLDSDTHLAVDKIDEDLEHVRNSVLTYGIPSFTGLDANPVNTERIQKEIKKAILTFEPRIVPDTLEVKAIGGQAGETVVFYEIRGVLWSLPFEEKVYLTTKVDFQTGVCSISRKSIADGSI